MLPTIIALSVIVVSVVLWCISTQRRLVVLDENINNALIQIGVQLSCQFDALIELFDLTKVYAEHESEMLLETIKSRRSIITAKSTPDDVIRQEGVISDALGTIIMMSEQYPELKADANFIRTMDAVVNFENMVRTSRLVYNDSITKLKQEIRMFPVLLIGNMLGYHKRDYLEDQVVKADMTI